MSIEKFDGKGKGKGYTRLKKISKFFRSEGASADGILMGGGNVCSVGMNVGINFTLYTRYTQTRAGICKQSMGARNRRGRGLSYPPARLQSLAEFIPWNRFRGPIHV